jgi:hypothetical protein
VFLLAAPAGLAAVPPITTNSPAVPPAAVIDPELLDLASRAVIARATDFFLNRAATNYMGLVVEPCRQRSIRKAYKARYRKEVIDYPIYKEEWDYEEVMVAAGGESVSDRKLVKVKRPIPGSVRRTLIRTEKRERLVDDPNGDIVKDYPEENYPELWQRTYLGQNALALYALLECGISEDEPLIRKMVETLDNFLMNMGLPDTTWDLAWLTCAYSRLSDRSFQKRQTDLVVKLLEGQITDGPARGLWGPVCINTTLLSSMLAYEQELSTTLSKRRELLQRAPNSEKLQNMVNEADVSLAGFMENYRAVTQQGLRFEEVTKVWDVPQHMHFEPLRLIGLPYYFYNQALADIESTALALFAAREAASRGFLPDELQRPRTPAGPILPPEKTGAVLARAAAAIGALESAEGLWDEGAIHEPIERMSPLGFRQLKKEDILKLSSERTFASTAQACTAMFDAGTAVGMEKLLGRYRNNVVAGQKAQRQLADAWLEKGTDAGSMPTGRYLSPYDFIFALRNVECALNGLLEDRNDLRKRLAFRVLKLQDLEGSWGKGWTPWQSPSLFWYENETVCKPAFERERASTPSLQKQTYDTNWYWRRRYIYAGRHYDSLDADVVCTAYAMLFLENGLRGPAAGFIKQNDQSVPPQLLNTSVSHLGKKDGASVSVSSVTSTTTAATWKMLPVLFMDSRTTLSDPTLRTVVGSYLKGPGTLAVEIADPAGGEASATALASLLQGGAVRELPDSTAFLARYQGARPRLRGLFAPDNRLAAVFLPASEIQGAYLLLREKVEDKFLNRKYPVSAVSADRAVARVAALHTLDESIRAALAPPEAPVEETVKPLPQKPEPEAPKPEDLSIPKPPPADVKKPRDDEQW